MAKRASYLRIVLAAASFILVGLLVYTNIHAIKRDSTRGNIDSKSPTRGARSSGLQRMLDQSKQSSLSRTATRIEGATVSMETEENINDDMLQLSTAEKMRVHDIETKVDGLRNALEELEKKFRSFGVGGDVKESEAIKLRSSPSNVARTSIKDEQMKRTKPRPHVNKEDLTGLNILLLYADDWTHHTLSSFHQTKPLNTILKTPILDALASEGIRFTHNCVTTSVCWVSRATLYTGQYLSRHKTKEPCCWNGMIKPKKKLDEPPENWKELSIYELLKENGYHVGHAGKWGVYMPFNKEIPFNVEEDGWHYRKIGKKMWHITEKNEADALRFLRERPKDQPFFLNVAFYATHAKDSDVRQYMPQESSMELYSDDTIPMPPTATEEAWQKMPYFFNDKNEGRTRWHWRYDNHTKHQTMMKNYYRMATEVDSACGAILEELVSQGVLDNTVVIFTTDNGNFHAEHGLADKWYPHQESIRVPLIIRDPRMNSDLRNTTNDEFTLNIDLAPTILSAAGLPIPEKMMGRDIAQLYLSENTEWRTEFFYEHPTISSVSYIPSSEALVRKNYKYMYWPDYKYEQLFDLVNDPGELEDLFNSDDPKNLQVALEMKKRFEELRDIVRSDEIVTL